MQRLLMKMKIKVRNSVFVYFFVKRSMIEYLSTYLKAMFYQLVEHKDAQVIHKL